MPRLKHFSAADLPRSFDGLIRLMPPAAIRDEVDYDNVQEMIDALTALPRLAAGQDRYLDTLVALMKVYEDQHEAIDTSGLTPATILKHVLEEHGMNASDLGRLLGERSLGPKILNGNRELSKAHIRILVHRFGIPADALLG